MNQTEKSSQKGILILGAGQLGMSVLRALASRLSGKTALAVIEAPQIVESTDPAHKERITEIRNTGATVIPFDLATASKSDLMSAFSPFETVVNCTGFVAGSGTQLRLTRAVIAAGVPRYVPWQFGVDYDRVRYSSLNDVFDEQYDVRLLLRAQETTEWVIVSTGMFTSFLFEPAFGIVDLETKTAKGLGSWETQVTTTSPEDVGLLTAEILLHSPRFANEVVFVAGDTTSYGQVADIAEEITGTPFQREELTRDILDRALKKNPGQMEKYRIAFAMGTGMHWPKSSTFNAQQGIETQTVQDWLTDHIGQQR
tara:strand:- start:1573 stop:2508 length:936 start_codon:yes stop_codon:yes gene_type:complete